MTPFLKSLAEKFAECNAVDLFNYCFIFPNNRSGVFFRKYLAESLPDSTILPDITTISEFVSSTCNAVEANRLELLFILYQEYEQLTLAEGSVVAPFDQFIYWGDMILNDFNDVDKYLSDAHKIFTNVKDYKEINSTFLSDEQLKVIAEYFGSQPTHKNDVDTFWTHIDPKSKSITKQGFLKFWEILFPLYKRFNDRLKSASKAYPGMLYRKSIEILENTSAEELEYKKYIFVGFNMLSAAEIKIFKTLQKKKVADFYWDFNSPVLSDPQNKVGRFIKQYMVQFPSFYTLEEKNTDFPHITVTEIPSNIGQVKYAARLLSQMAADGTIASKDNAIDTAIVLPDENLFIPTLTSIPNDITNKNITMGFPLKQTAIATLIKSLSILHNRARLEKGEWAYFHEDIKNVFSHPYILRMDAKNITSFVSDIQHRNLFTITYKEIATINDSIARIFTPIADLNNRDEVFRYFNNTIELVESILNSETEALEISFIEQYKTLISQLEDTLRNYTFDLQGKTYFFLIERVLSSVKIAFEGEPLSGLQIMGVLETRCLDFDNLIILSMNERVFPRKHFSKSFIPNNLRRAYGLATTDLQEYIYTYYFYRMISRAKNVHLIYDSRTQGIHSGEQSRFIYQLKYLYGENLHFEAGNFNIKIPQAPALNIVKDERIMGILNRYRNETGDEKYHLSASALKNYIRCPLKFYLSNVEKIRIEEEMTDFIDSATMGTIIHDSMKDLYFSEGSKKIMTATDILQLKKDIKLERIITKFINKHYIKKKTSELDTPLEGESLLISDVVRYYIEAILDYDSKFAPIEFIQAEKAEISYWRLSNGIGFKFKQYIDRVDRLNSRLRIIDYKTGSDSNDTPTIETLFYNPSKSAIFQLMLYCNFYSYYNQLNVPIQPVIYQIKSIKSATDFNITIGNSRPKIVIDDFRKYKDEFMEFFENMISDIFNPDIPFNQTADKNNCGYCEFKNICQR